MSCDAYHFNLLFSCLFNWLQKGSPTHMRITVTVIYKSAKSLISTAPIVYEMGLENWKIFSWEWQFPKEIKYLL